MQRLAVYSSSTRSAGISRAILVACQSGQIPDACVVLFVANKPNASVVQLAVEKQLPCIVVRHHDEYVELQALRQYGVDVILLIGYLPKIGQLLLQSYPKRILNVHPAPLSFGGRGMYGLRVHRAVLAAGVLHTGPTVHIVDEHYDHGAVIAHRPVNVLPGDNVEQLGKRCHDAAVILYPQAVSKFLGKLAKDMPENT